MEPTKIHPKISFEAAVKDREIALSEAWKLKDENIALREKIDELQETLIQIRQAQIMTLRVPLEWQLTPQEERFFLLLLKCDLLDYQCLGASLHPDPRKFTDMRTLKVVITRLRRKLASRGIEIKTYYERGYSLVDRLSWKKEIEKLSKKMGAKQ